MRERAERRFVLVTVLIAVWIFSCALGIRVHALEKPDVAAEGAALYNATSGEFIFEKNANQQFYPASITKLMTALLVLENSAQNETVCFTESATAHLESGAVSLALKSGDKLSVKDALYGLLLRSANEVANGLAEHVSGSVPAFAQRMNARAAELGCTGTQFQNPNGLTDAKHLTTAHDMALIAKACFERADFREIERSTVYHIPATANRPEGTTIVMGHKMISPGSSLYYPGILGGKTGYTSAAGNTLVTCAERDGVRLIAVVLKSRSTHYKDTKAMLDYGFALCRGAQQPLPDAQNSSERSPEQNAAAAVLRESIGPQGSAAAPSVPESAAGDVFEAQERTGNAMVQAAGTEDSGPGAVTPGWHEKEGRWRYGKANGVYACDERLVIGAFEYWFDASGLMITGWHQDAAGAWYYLRPSFGGMKKDCWLQDGGKWYYLGADGRMLTDTVTPDGSRVGADGVWTE
ncbi:D-alanyl-D-alanine carboxypeptidase [Fusobacterium naviforme]|nr:D-alanyl-D-alanine carboxypeptidase [Fusobacterium naviforme]PSL09555.1 D-alanyl-D-alanine carboxypeptidase [Fusobacterium naviforme]STO27453.1 D-alanyl-D-alanine carboxypeptidase dacB precursor [Fusobacterium naviforme]